MKRPPRVELPRLRDLPPGEDLVGVSELLRAAEPPPDLAADARQRIRARLRRDLAGPEVRHARWGFRLSPLLVVIAALVSASVVGAAVGSLLGERRLQRQDRGRERVSVLDVGPRPSPRRGRAPASVNPLAATAQHDGVGPQDPVAPPDPAGVRDLTATDAASRAPATAPPSAPSSLPSIARRAEGNAVMRAPLPHRRPRTSMPAPPAPAPTPLAPATETQAPMQAPAPTSPPPAAFSPPGTAPRPESKAPILALATAHRPAAAPVPAAASTLFPTEAELLAQAIRALRRDGNPDGALALLDRHGGRLASGPLAPEAAAVRIEALLQARRTSAALAALDRFPLDGVPGREEWRIVRAELRGRADRWSEAESDFSLALTGGTERLRDELVERALWGRATARARQGNASGARADQALYLQRFPDGRFAVQARRASSQGTPGGPRAP